MFPEGTNLTADTISKSNKFALENNLQSLTQVLHPRTTGFVHIFNEMNRLDLIDCIQDVTVGYRGGKMPENESDFLFGNLPHEIHFYVDKFDVSLLKKSDNKILENWLNDRWWKKELFLKE